MDGTTKDLLHLTDWRYKRVIQLLLCHRWKSRK